MSQVFLKIVNMSISASWLVLAVLLLRLLLKKAPKWVSVLLWGLVAIRLICPFTIESTLSLIPSAETVRPEIMMDHTPEVDTGIGSLNQVINPVIMEAFQPEELTSMNPLQLWIPLAAIVWIAGLIIMLLYTAISYLLLRRKVATAVRLQDHIFQSEHVASPFVLGIFRPRIYLPFQMDEKNLAYVIAHEEAHIRRRDHWWKPFGFFLLAIYWFNPLMWLGYILLCRDIELACDEKVIREMDNEAKADYTQALVACSISRRRISACPLAFGEVGVKNRIKSVMNYKKPAFWIILVAIILCVAVAVCFLTNPATSVDESLSVFIDCRIAEHFQTDETAGRVSCVNWKVLGTEKNGEETTVYMWVLYEEYSPSCWTAVISETGAHIPTAITAKRVNGGWQLVEYWEPRDGGYYVSDIKEKFPWYLWNKALDSQRYIDQQEEENRNNACDYFAHWPFGSQAYMLPVVNAVSGNAIDEKGNLVAKPESRLETAIAMAILSRGPQVSEGTVLVESHIILGSGMPLQEETSHRVQNTVFLYYMTLQFDTSKGVPQQPDGTYGYGILTFEADETGTYALKSFRDPKSSADYNEELLKQFAQEAEKASKKEQQNKQQLFTRCQLIAKDYIENRDAAMTAQPGGVNLSPVIDIISYDFDGDGNEEMCTLTYGPTSGVFSFCFQTQGTKDGEIYSGTYVLTEHGQLSFLATKDCLQIQMTDYDDPEIITYYQLLLQQGEVVLCQVN